MKKNNILGSVVLALVVPALILGLSSLVLALDGDINKDGFVDTADLDALHNQWLDSGVADIDYSGNVDLIDFALLTQHWWRFADPNLVVRYKLDESSGTTAHNSSMYTHNGTLLNEVTWAPTSGRFKGAASFDPVGSAYQQIELSTTGMKTSAGTIALWGRLSTQSQVGYRFFFGTKLGENRIQLYMNSTNPTDLDLGLGNMHIRHPDIITLQVETWYHIALTWAEGDTPGAGDYHVYVDANEVATGTYSGLNNLSSTANIGNNGDSATADRFQPFRGLIDDVGIWNRALDACDMEELYANGVSGEAPTAAWNPDPPDGAVDVPIDKVLSWSAGYYATSHDVYFGTDFNDVNDANDSSSCPEYKGNQTATTYVPGGLVDWDKLDAIADEWLADDCSGENDWCFGADLNHNSHVNFIDYALFALDWFKPRLELDTTYHWRIDEVEDTDTQKGRVWSFTTIAGQPGKAGNPYPPDTETGMSTNATLTWTAGDYTTSHDVYFGTNESNVTDADNGGSWTEYKGNQTETFYPPGSMDGNTPYYWRIDEVGPGGMTPGDVWSFTTGPGGVDAPVADFFAIPTSGWDIYYRPEFVDVSTGNITDYLWEFGDDQNSTELAPNHQYASPGTYTVSLTVSGPAGSDKRTKVDYITVNDFDTEYGYPDYVLTEATQAAFDTALNAIESGGGGRMLFDFNNVTVHMNWDHLPSEKRDFHGNNLIIDGQDKNVQFYYNGIHPCDQTENGPALRLHGDDNIIRNIAWDRFPDGISLRGGHRNLAENITTDIVCEDAITFNGGGYYCTDCIIRDCSFQDSNDKTIMVNGGGTTSRMVIKGCYSFNGNQPIRMTGSGLLVVRHCEFVGERNNGPRFGGNDNLVIFEHNYSHETKSGIRLTDSVSAIVRNNTMQNCRDYGFRIYYDTANCWARIENNIIRENNIFGIFLASVGAMAQIDLGGGSLDIHRHGWHTGPGTAVVPSRGGNILELNSPADPNDPNDYDLYNLGSRTIMAENNFWDHDTVGGVMLYDVFGSADVNPLGVP